jgi:hypothetical protein
MNGKERAAKPSQAKESKAKQMSPSCNWRDGGEGRDMEVKERVRNGDLYTLYKPLSSSLHNTYVTRLPSSPDVV